MKMALRFIYNFCSSFLAGLLIISSLNGCEGDFFGSRTSKDFLDTPVRKKQFAAYVPIQPAISDPVKPVDVLVGFDELIYVADAGTNEVINYDLSGERLGSFPIPGLKSIAQDRRLELLAIGETDTVISGNTYTLSTIYRLDLLSGERLSLDEAVIKNKVVHPFYFKSGIEQSDTAVRFQDLDVLANHEYYVTRTGPSNKTTQFGGPDNAVLLFSESDKFKTPIPVKTGGGVFADYFKQPKGIATFVKPPQSSQASEGGNFVYTSFQRDKALQVQFIEKVASKNGVSYNFRDLTTGDTSEANGFLYEPNRFSQPYDVTIAGDNTQYIFVTDRAKDSLYQFTSTGLEGVEPPPGSNRTKQIKVSFGGTGSGPRRLREPSGVAYYQEIVYVADAGNGRIVRFKLSTDFR